MLGHDALHQCLDLVSDELLLGLGGEGGVRDLQTDDRDETLPDIVTAQRSGLREEVAARRRS